MSDSIANILDEMADHAKVLAANGRDTSAIDGWGDRLAALSAPEASGADVETLARALVERLDAIHADPIYMGVWVTSQTHVGPYRGPKYDQELDALRSALNPAPPTSGEDSFVMVESAVRSLPPGYAFADAVEHANPAPPTSGPEVIQQHLVTKFRDGHTKVVDITPQPTTPADDSGAVCGTCEGVGTVDETLGGYHFSNPAATCPDCGGLGEPRSQRLSGENAMTAPSANTAQRVEVAELQRAIDQAQHKPGEWHVSATMMGAAVRREEPAIPGQFFPFNEVTIGQFPYKRDGWLAVAAVNALPVLLLQVAEQAAEIEQWKHNHAEAMKTIRMGQDFAGAIANEMRAAGCDVALEPLRIVNTRAEAAERDREEACRMIAELRDYVVNERDAQVLPRKAASYQRELDSIDAFLAANGQKT